MACEILVFTGFAFSLYGWQSNSSLQMVVPDRLRGRVPSLYGYVFFATAPIGGLLTGWMCGRFRHLGVLRDGGRRERRGRPRRGDRAAGAQAQDAGAQALPGIGGADASTVTARE